MSTFVPPPTVAVVAELLARPPDAKPAACMVTAARHRTEPIRQTVTVAIRAHTERNWDWRCYSWVLLFAPKHGWKDLAGWSGVYWTYNEDGGELHAEEVAVVLARLVGQ